MRQTLRLSLTVTTLLGAMAASSAGCGSTTRVYGAGGSAGIGGSAGSSGGASSGMSGSFGNPHAGSSGSAGSGGSAQAGASGSAGAGTLDSAGAAGEPNGGGRAGSNGGTGTGGSSGNAGSSAGGGAGGSSAGTGGASAGSAGSAGQGGSGGAPACNQVVNTAPPITLTHSSGTPPVSTQGTIAPGKYFLTADTVYGGGSGTQQVGATLDVTVVGSTATLKFLDADGFRTTTVITMATPSTMPPSSVIITCSTDPEFAGVVGLNIAAASSYSASSSVLSTLAQNVYRVFTRQG